MNIVGMPSGGNNIVGWPFAVPRWYPPATAPAARVQVWKHNSGQPVSEATLVATAEPGQRVEIEFNPVTDRNVVLRTVSFSASGTPSVSNLEDAVAAEVIFERDMAVVLGNDEHVPQVTAAPSISKVENASDWIIFTTLPDADAGTLKVGRLRIRKADELAVERILYIPVAGFHRIEQTGYPAVIDYAWQNQANEDVGEGRGWSEWSPTADAAEAGAAVQPPPPAEVLPTVTFDANDSMQAIERGVIIQ